MTIAATNQFVWDTLNDATDDDVEVFQGVQEVDDKAEFTEPAIVYSRIGSNSETTLDNNSAPQELVYNVVMINETAELVTDMEDQIRNHFQNQDQRIEVNGGQDSPPQKDEDGFARVISITVPVQHSDNI